MGFRGGSLDVFNRCEKKVKNNLNMVCNFRSAKEIVKFNNNFFERLF